MSFSAKLGFVHRALWQRTPVYRWVVLLGPPPLLGCALGALACLPLRQGAIPIQKASVIAPWAHWEIPVPQETQPYALAPQADLPRADKQGRFAGYRTGWQGDIQPLLIDATLDANVLPAVIGHFTLDQPVIPLARILDAGPQAGLFVGAARTFLVIRSAGLYAVSVRLARLGLQTANCLVRLGISGHRLVRSMSLDTAGWAVLNYPATELRLEPGLFALAVAVGCWRGDQMVGPGEVTLMIRHPGDSSLRPVGEGEVIRPAERRPG